MSRRWICIRPGCKGARHPRPIASTGLVCRYCEAPLRPIHPDYLRTRRWERITVTLACVCVSLAILLQLLPSKSTELASGGKEQQTNVPALSTNLRPVEPVPNTNIVTVTNVVNEPSEAELLDRIATAVDRGELVAEAAWKCRTASNILSSKLADPGTENRFKQLLDDNEEDLARVFRDYQAAIARCGTPPEERTSAAVISYLRKLETERDEKKLRIFPLVQDHLQRYLQTKLLDAAWQLDFQQLLLDSQ